MVQNLLSLTFKNATTGAVVDTVTFNTDEIPAGVTRNVPMKTSVFTTEGGRARAFTEPDGIVFTFSVVVNDPVTIQKLDYVAAYVSNGRIVDAQMLIGSMIYNAPSDGLVYNAGMGLISGGVVSAFDLTYRQMVFDGQQWRNQVAMAITQGGSNALPLAANYIGN